MNAITNPFTYDVGLARIDDLLRDAANHRLAREASQGSATNPRRISATPKRKENDMSAPFIFITEHTVKSGRLNDLERLTDEFVEFVEANEPTAQIKLLRKAEQVSDDGACAAGLRLRRSRPARLPAPREEEQADRLAASATLQRWPRLAVPPRQ